MGDAISAIAADPEGHRTLRPSGTVRVIRELAFRGAQFTGC